MGSLEQAMNEDVVNMSLRKFLKKVGVTSQREIEKVVRGALDAGRLKGTETLAATVAAREVKGPFRRARETRPARSGRFPVRPIRIQPRPIRSDRGWRRRRDRPPSAPYLFRCQDGAAHSQTRAEARAAALGAPRDSIRRSPEARWSSHPDAPRAPCAAVLLRSRQGLLSSKSACRALRNAQRALTCSRKELRDSPGRR